MDRFVDTSIEISAEEELKQIELRDQARFKKPKKKEWKMDWGSFIIFLILLCFVAAGLYMAFYFEDKGMQINSEYSQNMSHMQLVANFGSEWSNDNELDMQSDNMLGLARNREINWHGLSNLNPDIAAWLYIPGTNINYPVMRAETRAEYMLRDILGNPSEVGALAFDPDYEDGWVINGSAKRNSLQFEILPDYRRAVFKEGFSHIFVYTQDGIYEFIFYRHHFSQTRSMDLPEIEDKTLLLKAHDFGRNLNYFAIRAILLVEDSEVEYEAE